MPWAHIGQLILLEAGKYLHKNVNRWRWLHTMQCIVHKTSIMHSLSCTVYLKDISHFFNLLFTINVLLLQKISL